MLRIGRRWKRLYYLRKLINDHRLLRHMFPHGMQGFLQSNDGIILLRRRFLKCLRLLQKRRINMRLQLRKLLIQL